MQLLVSPKLPHSRVSGQLIQVCSCISTLIISGGTMIAVRRFRPWMKWLKNVGRKAAQSFLKICSRQTHLLSSVIRLEDTQFTSNGFVVCLRSYNFVEDDENAEDCDGHGMQSFPCSSRQHMRDLGNWHTSFLFCTPGASVFFEDHFVFSI